ncbi:MAG: hypothetical protein V3575_00780 [Candidatus Absconditabacteria bacterium]
MKIFNNFDTKLKENEFKEAIEHHGYDSVILVVRSKYYWIVKGIFPILLGIIGNIIIIYMGLYLKTHGLEGFYWIIVVLLGIVNIIFLYYLIMIYINYKMDFTIVSRDGISTYKQKGFFKNSVKNLPASNVRSVQSKRVGIMGNVFGYGYILLVTDGSLASNDEDETKSAGVVKLTYVDRPNLMRKRILDLCLGNSEIVYFKLKDYAGDL